MWAVDGKVEEINDDSDHLSRDEAIAGYADSCRLITGDRDGIVAIWRLVTISKINRGVSEQEGSLRLVLMKTLNTKDLLPAPTVCAVRSVCERDGVLLIGLQGCEIYEVIDNSVPFVEPPPPLPPVIVSRDSAAGHVSTQDTLAPSAVVPPDAGDNEVAEKDGARRRGLPPHPG